MSAALVPNHLRPILTGLAAAAAILAAYAFTDAAAAAGTVALKPYVNAMPDEAKSKELCESQPNRIFVQAGKVSECIAYFATKGHEKKKHAVMFLDGDISLEKFQDQAGLAKGTLARRKFMQQWADKQGQRFVDISRVGVNGSSGNHGPRRLPHETVIMNQAIDLLKVKLGLESVTLAGQSGGSTIAASLLTFGRKDVTCAVLGSGAYELVDLEYKHRLSKGGKADREQFEKMMYDPSKHVDGIAENPGRRILVLGDEADTKTPFDQQVRFVNAIREAGHHARLFPIDALGETDHNAAAMTIPVAGACARGDSDEKILKGIPRPAAKVASKS